MNLINNKIEIVFFVVANLNCKALIIILAYEEVNGNEHDSHITAINGYEP